MKKRDKQLLMLAALAGGGYYLYSKSKSSTPGVSGGVPGIGSMMIGATMPSHSIVPESMRGKCSPWWLDVGVWGLAGTALGYYGLAGKKL